jgi:hypothetical protein
MHYGGPDAKVQDLHAKGQLDLAALVDNRPSAHSQVHDEEQRADEPANNHQDVLGQDDLTANIHCARPDSREVAGVDVAGCVGATCHHGQPIRGCFADMPKPECLAYYIITLLYLVTRCLLLGDVYVDFACRLSIPWQHYLHAHTWLLQRWPHLRGVRLLVNWMHGVSHQASCQLVNCGRYVVGAGRRVGEHTEQPWARLKVRCVCSLCRQGALSSDRDCTWPYLVVVCPCYTLNFCCVLLCQPSLTKRSPKLSML